MSTLGGATRKFVDSAFTEETDGCIIWPFALDQRGYPQASDADGFYKPHRRICEMQHGAPPSPKHHAAHLCGIRSCVNKRHLVWATPQENEHHKYLNGNIRKGKRTLTDAQVRTIRRRHANGEMMKDIAPDFSLSLKSVSKIVNWVTYRDIR